MLGKFSLQARNLLVSVPKKAIPRPSLARPGDSTRCSLRRYLSKLDSPFNDVDDVDRQELKRRIDNFYKGDADALPSIFEAILQRKLSRKHEESDDDLMKDLERNFPIADDKDEESDSDTDSHASDLEELDSDTDSYGGDEEELIPDIDSNGSDQEIDDSDATKRRARDE